MLYKLTWKAASSAAVDVALAEICDQSFDPLILRLQSTTLALESCEAVCPCAQLARVFVSRQIQQNHILGGIRERY